MGVRNTATNDLSLWVDEHVFSVNDRCRKIRLVVRVTTKPPNLVKFILRRCFNQHGIVFGLRGIAAVESDVCCEGTATKCCARVTTPVQRVRHDSGRNYVAGDLTILELCSEDARPFYDLCPVLLRDNGGCNCYRGHRVGVRQQLTFDNHRKGGGDTVTTEATVTTVETKTYGCTKTNY